MQLIEHLATLEITHDAMFGAISTSWMNFVTLYLAIFAAPTPRARLFVRPSRRHMESVEEFTVEVAK